MGDITLRVNGTPRSLNVDSRTSLLDLLREHLGLTGSKKGCDHGQCGACTVLVAGRRVNACLTLAVMVGDSPITTIEGLGTTQQPSALQRAFIHEQACQCGYCSNGMIMAAQALLARNRRPSEAEVKQALEGHLCRCGAHNRIVRAVLRASREAPS